MSGNGGDEPIATTPSQADVAGIIRLMEPLRKLINPKVYGIENVPDRGALLVGNHTLLGVLDLPLLCAELWERGLMVRGLGDHAHFKVPGWRDRLQSYGMVRGTRANTAELMRRGELVMVFPGGGRELTKRKGEQYKLIWKNRMGFARLAIEHKYPIIPFASVGSEHGLDIVIDSANPLFAPARLFFEKVLGTPDTPPLVRGIGLTPIPRPERQYYWFGEPIQPAGHHHTADGDAREVRAKAAKAIETGIAYLLEERERDPGRSLVTRLFGSERR